MKKSFMAFLILLTMIVFSTSVFAVENDVVSDQSDQINTQQESSDTDYVDVGDARIYFSIENNEATVVRVGLNYNTLENVYFDVDIPDTFNGYPVTKIGDNAASNQYIRSVSLPDGLKTIGASAFEGCKFTQIEIPDSVETIGESAFAWSAVESIVMPASLKTLGSSAFSYSSLKEITLPEGLETIGENAFANTSLVSIQIPDSVETIGNQTFYLCRSLTDVKLSNNLKSIGSNAFLYTKLNEIALPEGLETIGDYAFGSISSLKKVSIPDSLKEIGTGAFMGTGLTEIQLPEGLETIGANAFAYTSLIQITLPESLQTLGNGAFSGTKIQTLQIPSKVKKFEGLGTMSELKNFELPDTIETIGTNAFYESSIADIVIPDSVSNFEENAFTVREGGHKSPYNGCQTLRVFANPNSKTAEYFSSNTVEGVIFISLNQTESNGIYYEKVDSCIRILAAKGTVSEIPQTIEDLPVTEIGDYAFGLNQNIQALTSDTITSIGKKAFADSSLETVSISSKISLGAKAFMYCKNLKSVKLSTDIIPECCFGYTTNLENLSLSGVKTLSTYFLYGSALTKLNLPNTLKTIEADAFFGSSIDNIILPESATDLTDGSIDLDNGGIVVINSILDSEDINPFKAANTFSTKYFSEIYLRPSDTEGTLMKMDFFNGNIYLDCEPISVYIPSNITDISDDTFGDLDYVYEWNNPEGYTVLDVVRNTLTIKCEEGSAAQAFAEKWEIPYVIDADPYYDVGDVTKDLKINSSDALMVLRSAVQEVTLDESEKNLANVTGDDKINSSDALQILRYTVKEIDHF